MRAKPKDDATGCAEFTNYDLGQRYHELMKLRLSVRQAEARAEAHADRARVKIKSNPLCATRRRSALGARMRWPP
jgi:hypothetical protein